MWFVGLIVGAMIGVLLPGSGTVLVGAAIGAIVGAVIGARDTGRRDEAKRLDEIHALYANLSSRLTIIEAKLGIGEPLPPAQPAASAEPDLSPPTPPLPVSTVGDPLEVAVAPAVEPAFANTHSAPTGQGPEGDGFARIWQWLIGGNILAKVGVVLLFFGVASGLRLAAQYGLIPVPVRLGLGAVAAVAMIWFGRDRVVKDTHRMFGFALQGGGFAILYLLVYFMLARYRMIGAEPAFVAFAAIGALCVLFAARQDAQSLAGLGISGAFLAPLLAATGSGDYVVLFSYYLLLNAFVVTVNWFKGWRPLNFAAFAFTFLVGIAWGLRSYQADYFATIEGFLIAFFLLFSLLPVLMILFDAPGKHGYADGLLFFGTPIAVAGIQQAIVESRDALAWSAAAAGVYYLALWYALFRRRDPATEIAERSHLGIGAVFLTLAIPLAFGVQVSTALWALEGSVLLWYGLRLQRALACAAGLLLQFGAGMYFVWHFAQMDHAQPVLNSLFIGSCIIAAAGLFSTRLLERAGDAPDWERTVGWVMLVWSLVWIAHAAWKDIDAFVADADQPAALLGVGTALALAFERAGSLMGSLLLRVPAWLLTLAVPAATALQLADHSHLLTGWFAPALPVAFVAQYWVMHRFDRAGPGFGKRFRHVVTFWVIGLAVSTELAWWTGEMPAAAAQGFWKLAAWMATGVALIATAIKGGEAGRWPFSEEPGAYFIIACAPVLVLLGVSVIASGYYSAGWGLPYVPPLNPLEIAAIAAIAAIVWWGNCAKANAQLQQVAAITVKTGYFLGFVLINIILARVTHHWFRVAYDESALYHSALFQGLLSFVWTCLAIALMIHASRNLLRPNWFVGFALLAIVGLKLLFVDFANSGTVTWTATLIGVALLVIAAGYFAPRPPSDAAKSV